MFALFYSLYYAMFVGSWIMYDLSSIKVSVYSTLNALGSLITSIFGDFQLTNFADAITTEGILSVTALVLALITSIGIVFAAGKVLKKIFGVFFVIGR